MRSLLPGFSLGGVASSHSPKTLIGHPEIADSVNLSATCSGCATSITHDSRDMLKQPGKPEVDKLL